ncbi:MAG: tetratricopeptide repeat protein, partial [Actinobacteria bacterium]|nr:tetratricopeptide repeat protein [Actinomycetota bacterium]
VLASQRRFDDAEGHFKAALAASPRDSHALFGLGRIMQERGQLDGASTRFAEALRSDPDLVEAHVGLGMVAGLQGNHEAAVEHYSDALHANPASSEAHFRLGLELETLGRTREAIEHYRSALLDESERVDAANNLAWVLATCPDPDMRSPTEAVWVAEKACRIRRRREPDLLDTLGAAYAAAGRFEDAVAAETEAIAAASREKRPGPIKEIRARLALFRSGRPYVESRD